MERKNVRGQASLLHQPCHYIVGSDLEGKLDGLGFGGAVPKMTAA